jgi:hypothetical protein
VFDSSQEQKVLTFMDPSPDDAATRVALEAKSATLKQMRGEFVACADKLERLTSALSRTAN